MMMTGHTLRWISLGQQGTTDPSAPPPAMASGSQHTAPGVETNADGIVQEGSGEQPVGPFGDNFFLVLVFVMIAVVGFSMLSGRKQKKQKAAMMAAIGKNDTVQTIGGIIGRVVELKPDSALLEVDRNSNSRITVSRAALQQVVEPAGAGSDDKSTDD